MTHMLSEDTKESKAATSTMYGMTHETTKKITVDGTVNTQVPRTILHITVGSHAPWDPTETELETIKGQFKEALDSSDDVPLVVTRQGVNVEYIEISHGR